jgi:Tol biopolymer transport system component
MPRISLALAVPFLVLAAASQAQTTTPIVNGGSPLVSPSAPRILFESNRTGKNQLWIISADGTGERQLTNRDTDVDGAQWAADGKSILYSVLVRDTSRVYELWPDSSRERPIGAYPGRAPHFSPARDQVLYDVGPWTASHLVLADANALGCNDSVDMSPASDDEGRAVKFAVNLTIDFD